MRIFVVNFIFAGCNQPARLVFADETRAKTAAATQLGMDGSFVVSDDFGTEVRTAVAPIARVCSDVIEEANANIEMGLIQARAQMKAQQKAKNDPTLNGGAIFQPGDGGPILNFPGGR